MYKAVQLSKGGPLEVELQRKGVRNPEVVAAFAALAAAVVCFVVSLLWWDKFGFLKPFLPRNNALSVWGVCLLIVTALAGIAELFPSRFRRVFLWMCLYCPSLAVFLIGLSMLLR